MSAFCPQCGAPTTPGVAKCEYCGATVAQPAQPVQQAQPTQQVIYTQQAPVNSERANWPVKSKIVAALLAFLLGSIGVHKFYLGKAGQGVMYLIFCWTYIPAILALIDAVVILCSSDENFQIKYKCRIG